MKSNLYKNILIAVDGSEPNKKAISLGLELAKLSEAKIYAVYVTDTTAFASIPMDAGWEVMYNLIKEEGNKATSSVKDLAKSMELDTESVIIEGNPGIEIIKFSEENEIDVIVIGKTGKSMLDKFLLGSVADKVIRKSKIPVLVIRG